MVNLWLDGAMFSETVQEDQGAMLPGIEYLIVGDSNLSKVIYLCTWIRMSQIGG